MRIIYVSGFFRPVQEAIQANFQAELQTRSVIFIPPTKNGGPDLSRFKELFFDSIERGATEVYVMMVKPPHYWAADQFTVSVNGIFEAARRRSAHNVNLTVTYHGNARDVAAVIGAIKDFQPNSGAANPPTTLKGLRTWCDLNTNGKVVILPKAMRAATRSRYADPPLLYRALSLLAEEYRSMLLCKCPADAPVLKSKYEAKIEQLGLHLSPSISETRAGEQGHDYLIKYPADTGQTRMLDMHLKKGVDHDERTCLRIYFFWESNEGVVVVGWMPSHLGTRAS